MDGLYEALRTMSERALAHRSSGKRLSEADTKAALIEPVLAALGWDVQDPDQVRREYRGPSGKQNPVDYALFSGSGVQLYVEAKALSESLTDVKVISQLISYCSGGGAAWGVLTNGHEWHIYTTQGPGAVEEGKKVLAKFTASADDTTALRLLPLLRQGDHVAERLNEQWAELQTEDALITVLHTLLDPASELLVKSVPRPLPAGVTLPLLRKLAPSVLMRWRLVERQVAPSSDRPTVALAVSVTPDATEPKAGSDDHPEVDGKRASLRSLVEAGLIRPGEGLYVSGGAEGDDAVATVSPDGAVQVGERKYASVSAAATAVSGWKAANGWVYWAVKRDGGLVRLNLIRDGKHDQTVQPEQPSPAMSVTSSDYISVGPSGRRTYHVTLGDLQSAGLLVLPALIRTSGRKRVVQGYLDVDGSVDVEDQKYPHLRVASTAVRGTSTPDWWTFWEVERNGKYVRFDRVREEFLDLQRAKKKPA